MVEQLRGWDPSIAALIAKWRRNALNPFEPIASQDRCRQCADELESALTSHVWDRNAPTVPYLGQMLPRDIDVARTFNESSDPRAMLAFIKLLAVGRAPRASALRGVRVTKLEDQKEHEALLTPTWSPPCPACVSEFGRVDEDCPHCDGTGMCPSTRRGKQADLEVSSPPQEPTGVLRATAPEHLEGPAGGARGEADARERDAGSPQSTGASDEATEPKETP